MAEKQEEIEGYVQRLSGRAWGIAFGLLAGLGLFVATNFLLLAGGKDVGKHLKLLSVYFPGYDVSFLGSVVGFVYAFVVGYATGRILSSVYNLAARAR